MAKLKTSASNLELITNKVKNGAIPSSTWTDSQYPSGKTLYNTYDYCLDLIDGIYPIGSTLCMATNTNPSSIIGGTWSLIDKDFAHKQIQLTADNWKDKNATFYSGNIFLYGKIVRMNILVTITKALTDTTVVLGKINYASVGLPESLLHGAVRVCAQGDGLQAKQVYILDSDGTIEILDSLYIDGTHNARLDVVGFTDISSVAPANMPDDLCNKFYFKRTA